MKHKDIRYLLNENATALIKRPEIYDDIVNDNALCQDIQRMINESDIDCENYKNLGRYCKKVKELAEDYFVNHQKIIEERMYPLLIVGNHYYDIQHTIAYLSEMKIAEIRNWKGHMVIYKGSMAAMILIVCYNIKRKIGAS